MLCEEFCFTTRQSLVDVLEETRHTMRVDLLLSAIKKTINFEKELSERFGTQTAEVIQTSPTQDDADSEEEEEDLLPGEQNQFSREAIKARWKKKIKEEQRVSTHF